MIKLENVSKIYKGEVVALSDASVEVTVSGIASEPAPESPSDGDSFRLLQTTISQVFPGTLAAPNLLSGGTDTKHFQKLTDNVYRFIPVPITAEDLDRVHGTNERVSVEGKIRAKLMS